MPARKRSALRAAKTARATAPVKRAAKVQRGKARRPGQPRQGRAAPEPETSLVPANEPVQESLLHIAQDAVVILRHELAKKAELAQKNPGWMSMSDCIALLRLTAELGDAAKRGEGGAQPNYDRLSPEEREQLAVLLLKVDYA